MDSSDYLDLYPIFRCFRKIVKHAHELRHFCPSDCLSDRIEQLGSHETGNHESWWSSIFRTSVEKIQV